MWIVVEVVLASAATTWVVYNAVRDYRRRKEARKWLKEWLDEHEPKN